MDLINFVENMSQDMYLRLKHAAETGKWPEGTEAGKEQQERALQLIMAYQAKHLESDDIFTVGSNGEIVNKTKRQLKDSFAHPEEAIARFTNL